MAFWTRMRSKRKPSLAVVGTINSDRLLRYDSQTTAEVTVSSLGGALYSLLALRYLMPEAHIHHLANQGRDISKELDDFYQLYRIDSAGVNFCDTPNNQILLDCSDQTRKSEFSELNLPGIEPSIAEELGSTDAVLVNFTSGLEFDLQSFTSFKAALFSKNREALLHMDLHSLSLDYSAGRIRMPKYLDKWKDWLEGVTHLQMTLEETWSLDGIVRNNLNECDKLIDTMLSLGLRDILITDGSRGMLFADENTRTTVAALTVSPVIDTTGCGDVCGAVLLAARISGIKMLDAVKIAAQATSSTLRAAGILSLNLIKPIYEYQKSTYENY